MVKAMHCHSWKSRTNSFVWGLFKFGVPRIVGPWRLPVQASWHCISRQLMRVSRKPRKKCKKWGTKNHSVKSDSEGNERQWDHEPEPHPIKLFDPRLQELFLILPVASLQVLTIWQWWCLYWTTSSRVIPAGSQSQWFRVRKRVRLCCIQYSRRDVHERNTWYFPRRNKSWRLKACIGSWLTK